MIYPNRLLILLSAILAGCTTISINSADGYTKIERSFGFASVSISPITTPVVVEMTTLGFSSSPAGYSVGLSNQEFASFSDACKVIFWIKNQSQVEAVRSIVNSSKDFCLYTTNQ